MILPRPEGYEFKEFRLIDGQVTRLKQVVVHRYLYSDESYVPLNEFKKYDGLIEWMHTDHGKWVIENSFEIPITDAIRRVELWRIQVSVIATFETKKLAEYYLRFGTVTPI